MKNDRKEKNLTYKQAVEDGYEDLVQLAKKLHHKMIVDEHGTYRWKKNSLICDLYDNTPIIMMNNENHKFIDAFKLPDGYNYKLSLNEMWIRFYDGQYSLVEMMKFYMDIGMSLCGFLDVFSEETVQNVLNNSKNPKFHHSMESVL